MPFPLPGPEIDADEALGEQVAPGPMAAVVVARRRLDRQIRQAEIFVDRDLRPDAGVAVLIPRVVHPRVVAEFSRHRNRVEDP